MAKIASVEFTGKSGKTYPFNVYPIDEECADEAGVYIFSERKPNGQSFNHSPKYIGMAQSFVNRMYNHHKVDCAKENGANCLCLHQIPNEKERIAAELDLLGNYNTPCNETNN